MGSSHFIFFISFFIFFFFLSTSLSLALDNNFTLYGDASFFNDAISLTQEAQPLSSYSSSSSSPSSFPKGVGRALYTYPIRFLDPLTNSTASFSCHFAFVITPTPSQYSSGDGLIFLITSNATSVSSTSGYMGLPNHDTTGAQESFIAVEFDTSFDPRLGDTNDNHIGLDVDTVVSFASVEANSVGIDLKSGRYITSWIEYEDEKKMMSVWVSYSPFKPPDPILSVDIDLSEPVVKEFMHIGFSASNGQLGSARHLVQSWQFKTYGFHSSPTNYDRGEEDDNECSTCLADSVDFDFLYTDFHVQPRRKTSKAGDFGLGLGGGAAAFLLVSIGAVGFWFRSHRSIEGRNRTRELTRSLPTRLSLYEIKAATRGFHQSRIIGEGASGVVYEGSLKSGKEVAIKRFSQINQLGPFSDPFTNELAANVGCLKHKHLVKLLGWCSEGKELVLVYEHMANGSLDKILHKTARPNSPTVLTWERRQKIILGVASALIYLHEECETQIIHRDVKTCNIMLDAEYTAKLGDFGLAELYERNRSTREATIPAGTMGYLAPEYVHTGVPTDKSDVYSFGVVVLEVATGRLAVDNEGIVLVDWVWEMRAKGTLLEAVDQRLQESFDKVAIEGMLMVGLSCVHPDSTKRPTMKEAERMLRGEAPFPILPRRKPETRLVFHLPQDAEDILQADSPWSTPRTHFN